MILCILKGKMPFIMHKIIFFPEKKIQTSYPKHIIFYLALPEQVLLPYLVSCLLLLVNGSLVKEHKMQSVRQDGVLMR